MIRIDYIMILQILFRIGLMLLAFYLGTKYFLLSRNFANFSMYSIFRTCKETFPECEEACPYYSDKEKCCMIQHKKPKDWGFGVFIGKIKRKDA